MTNIEFKSWINGYFELAENSSINKDQIEIIKNHANLVYDTDQFLDQEIQEFLQTLSNANC